MSHSMISSRKNDKSIKWANLSHYEQLNKILGKHKEVGRTS